MMRSMRHGGFDFRDIRALVVEDEEFARTLTSQVLRSFGCKVVKTATNGNQAIDFLTTGSQSYHLVICDFRMPQMNGLELLKALRKGLPGVARDIPFAMLTGHADKPVVGLAFELDVDCFLIKPITAAVMNERLVRVLSTDRPVKSPYDYHDIDLDSATQVAEAANDGNTEIPAIVSPGDRATEASPEPLDARDQPAPLTSIRSGAVLAKPIATSSGHVLLQAGTELDQRTIERLQDLAEIDPNLKTIYLTTR